MKREEILAMEPGRELDDMVMRTIFEARRAYHGEDEVWYHYDENSKPDYEWDAYNSPSTRITAAWEVVEKMRTNKIYLDIRVWPDEYQVLPHQDENNKLIDRWIVKSPSLPEAISKAALLAVLEGES